MAVKLLAARPQRQLLLPRFQWGSMLMLMVAGSVRTTRAFSLVQQGRCRFHSSTLLHLAKPKRAGTALVDSYQTVSVNCAKCRLRLFRYKKKNGTKSNLVKCFVERISEDCADVLANHDKETSDYACPHCGSVFARPATIRGLPALKLVGGKIRMTKK